MYWICEAISENKYSYSMFTCEENHLIDKCLMQLGDLTFDYNFFACEENQNVLDFWGYKCK